MEKLNANEAEQLKELSSKLEATTKYSSIEIAETIESLVNAKVSVEQIVNGTLEGILYLADAGALELKE